MPILTSKRSTKPNTGPADALPAPGLVPPPRLRRRPVVLLGAVAAVVIGALGSSWLWTAFSPSSEVLALRQTVMRGQVIDRADLMVVRVGTDPALQAVPAARMDEVAGSRAALDVAAGGLLTEAGIAPSVVPASGWTLVGVALAPGMLPAEPLNSGDRVRAVQTPAPGGDVDTAPVAMDATVVGVTVTESGQTLVDLLVPSTEAAELAARGATGRLALVLESRER